MQKLHILAIVLVIVSAQEGFLEKQKHVKQQKDLSTEIYTIKKQGLPTFLGRSTEIEGDLSTLMNYEEAMKQTPQENQEHVITFVESMYIIDQPNPNAVRATEQPQYQTVFPKHKDNFSHEKVSTFKNGCIYVFSECNFKGAHAKSCHGETNAFFDFPFEVLSVHIPEGGSMTLIQENGSKAYTGTNKCMRSNPIEFLFIEGQNKQIFGDGNWYIG